MRFQELVIEKLKPYYKALPSETALAIAESYVAFLITKDNPLKWSGRIVEDVRLYARQPVNEEHIRIGFYDEDFRQAFDKYKPTELLGRFPVPPKKPFIYEIPTNVAGISFCPRQWLELVKEERIRIFDLVKDPSNIKNTNAVKVVAKTSKATIALGYIPDKVRQDDYLQLSRRVSLYLSAGDVVTCSSAGGGFTGGTPDKPEIGLNIKLQIATVV